MAKVLTRWTPEEWFIVIRYLYQTEQITLDHKHDLLHLDTKTIRRAAQEISDPSRRREDVTLNLPQIRDSIRKYIAIYKPKLEGASLRHQPSPEPDPLVAAVGQQTNDLMSLFAAKVVEGLQPELVDRVCERMKIFLAETLISYGALKPNTTVEEVVYGKRKEEQKIRIKVGLVGMLPIQVSSMKEQFREVDFTSDEATNLTAKDAVRKFRNQDLVLIMAKKCNHGVIDALVADFKNQGRYASLKREQGGPTEMARSLRVWLSEQAQLKAV